MQAGVRPNSSGNEDRKINRLVGVELVGHN